MTLEFGTLNRKELRQAAELAARAFGDYEYFTNWFPDPKERAKVESAIIWCSYKTNFSSAPQLTAKLDGKIVALAELNAPDHKDPSVMSYILHGWLKVYIAAGLKRVNDWIAMDAAVAIIAEEKGAEKPPRLIIAGIRMMPSAATVAGPEPEIAPKKHATITHTIAIPPR